MRWEDKGREREEKGKAKGRAGERPGQRSQLPCGVGAALPGCTGPRCPSAAALASCSAYAGHCDLHVGITSSQGEQRLRALPPPGATPAAPGVPARNIPAWRHGE